MTASYNFDPVVRDKAGRRMEGVRVEITRGEADAFRAVNESGQEVQIEEVCLTQLHYPMDTPFWAEGYNMLSMYGGTLAEPRLTGTVSDRDHYRMPQTEGAFTVYNVLQLNLSEGFDLYAFTTCRRFRGEFRLYADRVEVVQVLEGITLQPGETVELEEFLAMSADKYETLYETLREMIHRNHPPLGGSVPTGWCSWYCYGTNIDLPLLTRNMEAIQEKLPQLQVFQIDDGYEKFMGDWLDESDKLGVSVGGLCKVIADHGMVPGIWTAPFTAEKDSRLFLDHPDWFVMDDEGKPLSSDRVTYPGWRAGPWYMLDTSHPEARRYLQHVFSTMYKDLGCRYFKMDANMWGALPFGRRHQPNCTSIEAYRMGMEAILEVLGPDAFVLGCNSALWPTLGLVHGMRISADILRNWPVVKQVTYECFHRQYQHGSFWLGDPDCLLLHGAELTEEEKRFHLSCALASCGAQIISDPMPELTEGERIWMQQLLDNRLERCVFLDSDCTIARGVSCTGEEAYLFFNPTDEKTRPSQMVPAGVYTELWSGEKLEVSGDMTVTLAPHAARVYLRKK